MRYVITIALLIAAVIHLLPVSGVLGSARLTALYGIDVSEPNLAILMRHRAMLFGLLGVFLVIAAFRPSLQDLALGAGLISVISFIWIAKSEGGYNAAIARVFAADVIALVALLIGVAAFVYTRFRSGA